MTTETDERSVFLLPNLRKNNISLKIVWLEINLDAHTAHGICLHLKSTILGLVILTQPNSPPVRSKKEVFYAKNIFKLSVERSRFRVFKCFHRSRFFLFYFSTTNTLEVILVRT